jgi:hypothetical protein
VLKETTDSPLQFDAETHSYTWRGKQVPSVTQVLKDTGLIDDQWYTERSRQIGQAVHLATEYDDLRKLREETVSVLIRPYLDAWRKFRAETGFTPLPDGIERRIYNQSAQYAGTLDRRGTLGAGEILLDIKTGQPQPWHAWQLAAYAMADIEPRRYRRARVQLRSDGTYRYTEFPAEDLSADYNIFHCARTAWQYQARRINGNRTDH